MSDASPRAGGRPRSEPVRQAILDATWSLLGDGGFASMTMQGIARAAGSSTATLYRWWPHKAAVAMDAVMARLDPEVPFPDTGSALEDFRHNYRLTARLFARDEFRHMLVGIIAEAQGDPELRAAFRERLQTPRRDQGRAVLQRGIERGELRPDLDADALFDEIVGAFYLQTVFGAAPPDERYADRIVEQAFAGILRG